MRLLLDTHVFLWAVTGSPKLKPPTRRMMESAQGVYVSAASIWEIAIKIALGKLQGNVDLLVGEIEAGGFSELPVRAEHAAAVIQLPPHHNDPFDRLLVAQAVTEPLRLITADEKLAAYTDLVTVI